MATSQQPVMVKCVVLGQSGVGKSSILFRYANDGFDELNQPTLGASFVSKTEQIGEKLVKFQIWDTAGQQKYKSIAPIYYRQSQIALCVYDISDKKSFESAHRWVQQLQEKGPQNIMMILVGNKSDKVQEQQVTYQQGKNYADQINAIFRLTSAKEGKGIHDMFITIGQTYLERKGQKQDIAAGKIDIDARNNSQQNGKKKCCS